MSVETEILNNAIECFGRFARNEPARAKSLERLATKMTGFDVEVFHSSVEFLIAHPRGRLTLPRPFDAEKLLGWDLIRVCSPDDEASIRSLAAADLLDMEDREHALSTQSVIADAVRDLIGDAGRLEFFPMSGRLADDGGRMTICVTTPGSQFHVSASIGPDSFLRYRDRLGLAMAPYMDRNRISRSA